MVWEPQAGQCGRSKDRSGAARRGGWRGQSSDGPIRCVKNAGLQPRRARLTWKDCCEYRQRCVWAHRTQGWREAERNREQRDFSGRCLMPLPTSASSAPARRPSVLPWPPAWPWEAWAWAVLGKEPAGLPGMSLALPSTKRFPSHLTPVRHLQSRLRRSCFFPWCWDLPENVFLKSLCPEALSTVTHCLAPVYSDHSHGI